jgi:hypothetical protein
MFKYIFLFLPYLLFSQSSKTNSLEINWMHTIDSQQLTLDTVLYKNNLSQSFHITKFKYYISNITLEKESGNPNKSKEVFLINEEEASSKKISISKIKNGEYSYINFILGVDSLRNCFGAQSGALDPIQAMFWTWNTGYIFLKLEGKSSSSTAPGKIFEYHIGGYKEPVNSIQSIRLKLNKPLVFSKTTHHTISIDVNLAELLRNPIDIDFSTLPSVTDTKNAVMISTNYKDMFSIR